jgi:hypothetical protein
LSGVREGTTGDIQKANGNKNALDEHAQVRLDHVDDLGMVGVRGGGGYLRISIANRKTMAAGARCGNAACPLHSAWIDWFCADGADGDHDRSGGASGAFARP